MLNLLTRQSLGVALFSYAGRLHWGFIADWDLVPDLHDFVVAIERAFAELCEAAGPAASGAAARAARSATTTPTERSRGRNDMTRSIRRSRSRSARSRFAPSRRAPLAAAGLERTSPALETIQVVTHDEDGAAARHHGLARRLPGPRLHPHRRHDLGRQREARSGRRRCRSAATSTRCAPCRSRKATRLRRGDRRVPREVRLPRHRDGPAPQPRRPARRSCASIRASATRGCAASAPSGAAPGRPGRRDTRRRAAARGGAPA